MKVLVCVKQVINLDDEILLGEDGRDVDTEHAERGLNEWDSFAIEEGLRLRDAFAAEVVAVTYGPPSTEPVLRRVLAMGVDRAVRVEGDAPSDPYSVGAGLAIVARSITPDLILCGAQSSDSAHAATGSLVAGFLDLPCIAVVTSVQVDPSGGVVEVVRELGNGVMDRLRTSLPAVLTVQTGINKPRYANLRAIKRAELESIEVVAAEAVDPAFRVRSMFMPATESLAQPLGADLGEAAETLAKLVRGRVR